MKKLLPLTLALATLLVAAFLATRDEDAVVGQSAEAGQASPAADVKSASPEPAPEKPPIDLFAVRTWQPPPPPPPPPAPPPPPQAPPMPFKFLGRIVEEGRSDIFLLTAGDTTLSVAVGDVIENHYLVEKFEAGQIHFLYRPLNIRQTLYVGSSS